LTTAERLAGKLRSIVELRRRIGEAIPIHPLHVSGLIGLEEEVAAAGAPRERQRGAGIHDAGSGNLDSPWCGSRNLGGIFGLASLPNSAF